MRNNPDAMRQVFASGEICNVCDGTGKNHNGVQCSTCEGTGRVASDAPCRKCEGSGKVNPDTQTVRIGNSVWSRSTCNHCQGFGKRNPPKKITCAPCSGAGSLPAKPCSYCHGSGQIYDDRTRYGGSGRGSGYIQCRPCAGKGSVKERCKPCDGFGYLWGYK